MNNRHICLCCHGRQPPHRSTPSTPLTLATPLTLPSPLSLTPQADKCFLTADSVLGIRVFSYDGRAMCNPKMQGTGAAQLTRGLVALASDTLAVVTRNKPMSVQVRGGRAARVLNKHACRQHAPIPMQSLMLPPLTAPLLLQIHPPGPGRVVWPRGRPAHRAHVAHRGGGAESGWLSRRPHGVSAGRQRGPLRGTGQQVSDCIWM